MPMISTLPIYILIMPIAILIGTVNFLYWKTKGYTSKTYLVTGICVAYLLCYKLGKIIIS